MSQKSNMLVYSAVKSGDYIGLLPGGVGSALHTLASEHLVRVVVNIVNGIYDGNLLAGLSASERRQLLTLLDRIGWQADVQQDAAHVLLSTIRGGCNYTYGTIVVPGTDYRVNVFADTGVYQLGSPIVVTSVALAETLVLALMMNASIALSEDSTAFSQLEQAFGTSSTRLITNGIDHSRPVINCWAEHFVVNVSGDGGIALSKVKYIRLVQLRRIPVEKQYIDYKVSALTNAGDIDTTNVHVPEHAANDLLAVFDQMREPVHEETAVFARSIGLRHPAVIDHALVTYLFRLADAYVELDKPAYDIIFNTGVLGVDIWKRITRSDRNVLWGMHTHGITVTSTDWSFDDHDEISNDKHCDDTIVKHDTIAKPIVEAKIDATGKPAPRGKFDTGEKAALLVARPDPGKTEGDTYEVNLSVDFKSKNPNSKLEYGRTYKVDLDSAALTVLGFAMHCAQEVTREQYIAIRSVAREFGLQSVERNIFYSVDLQHRDGDQPCCVDYEFNARSSVFPPVTIINKKLTYYQAKVVGAVVRFGDVGIVLPEASAVEVIATLRQLGITQRCIKMQSAGIDTDRIDTVLNAIQAICDAYMQDNRCVVTNELESVIFRIINSVYWTNASSVQKQRLVSLMSLMGSKYAFMLTLLGGAA